MSSASTVVHAYPGVMNMSVQPDQPSDRAASVSAPQDSNVRALVVPTATTRPAN